jgi:hypothetical protein
MHACRNERKKRALAETKARCARLAADNEALAAALAAAQRDGYAVAERFREELVAKNARVARLEVGRRGWLAALALLFLC